MADLIHDSEAFIQKILSFEDASGGPGGGFIVEVFNYQNDTVDPDPDNKFFFHDSVSSYRILKSKLYMDQWGGLGKLPPLFHQCLVSGTNGVDTREEYVNVPLYYRAHLYHGPEENSLAPFPEIKKPQGDVYDDTFSLNSFFFHYPSGIVDGEPSSQAHVGQILNTDGSSLQRFTDYRNTLHRPVEIANMIIPRDHNIYMVISVNDNEATVQDYMASAFVAAHPAYDTDVEVQIIGTDSVSGMQRTIELTNEEVARAGTGKNVNKDSGFCVFSISYTAMYGGRAQLVNGSITVAGPESTNPNAMVVGQKLTLYENEEWHHTIRQVFEPNSDPESVPGGKGRLVLSQVWVFPFTDVSSQENVFDLVREFPAEGTWSPQELKFGVQTSAYGEQGVVISSVLASSFPDITFSRLSTRGAIQVDPKFEKVDQQGNTVYQGDKIYIAFRETDLSGTDEMVIGYTMQGSFYKDLPSDIYRADQWWTWNNTLGVYEPIPTGMSGGKPDGEVPSKTDLDYYYEEDSGNYDLVNYTLPGDRGGY